MSNKRKKYSAQEKVRLLRLHLIEKEPVSDNGPQFISKDFIRISG